MTTIQTEQTTVEQGETLAENKNFKLVNGEQPESDLPQDVIDARETVRRRYAIKLEKESEAEEAKSIAKAAKESYDQACVDLTEVIDAHLPGGQPRLFPNGQAEPAPEAWRCETLRSAFDGYGLPTKRFEQLEEAGVTTLGELADYTKEHQLTDIKGIGEKSAGEIESAVERYWQEHPLQQETPSDDALQEHDEDERDIEDMGLDGELVNKLHEAGIGTAGELRELHAGGFPEDTLSVPLEEGGFVEFSGPEMAALNKAGRALFGEAWDREAS